MNTSNCAEIQAHPENLNVKSCINNSMQCANCDPHAKQGPYACITAISGRSRKHNCFSPHFIGETLSVHRNFTEFNPHIDKFTVKGQPIDIEGFKTLIPPKLKKHKIESYPGYREETDHEFENRCQRNKMRLRIHKYVSNGEKRYYPSNDIKTDLRPSAAKRGIITKVSRKSANRLKKMIASVPDLSGWIDLTFADDVLLGKNFEERRNFAMDRLNIFKRHVHKKGLEMIWKKEFKDRKSGQFKGLQVPHFHIALTGFTEYQMRNFAHTCLMLLINWVRITGTQDPNALLVAIHKDKKTGKHDCFRIIKNSRQAIAYIGKYFSKTDDAFSDDGMIISIGRGWGYSASLKNKLPEPHTIWLNRQQAQQFRRFMRRYKKLKHSKGRIGIGEQIMSGFATYLFADETTILRFLVSIGVDITQNQGVPF